ncbi:hypothetical protein RFI_40048, partial [Reticulomyxa filosa]
DKEATPTNPSDWIRLGVPQTKHVVESSSPFGVVQQNTHKYHTLHFFCKDFSVLRFASFHVFDALASPTSHSHSTLVVPQIVSEPLSCTVAMHLCREDSDELPKTLLHCQLSKVLLRVSKSTVSGILNAMEDVANIATQHIVAIQVEEPLLPSIEEMDILDQMAGHIPQQQQQQPGAPSVDAIADTVSHDNEHNHIHSHYKSKVK